MILGKVPISFSTESKSFKTDGLVTISDGYKKDVHIAIEMRSHALFSVDDTIVSLPDGSTLECVCTDKSYSSTQDVTKALLKPLRSPFVVGAKAQALTSLRALVVNFIGNDFIDIKEKKLALTMGEWTCLLTPTGERTVQFPRAMQSELYQVTHMLELNRSGQAFSGQEAIEQLTMLQRFLSFCHGHQVGVGHAVALDDSGDKRFEEFGVGRVDFCRSSDCWFDRHHAAQLPPLYEAFVRKLQDPFWSETFHIAMYWTTRGDTNIAGPDGSIVLLQAALERLAWDVLTQGPARLSKRAFGKLNTAARLRSLLKELGIPVGIPTGLKRLQATVSKATWADGPEAFAAIRNELTHPKKLVATVGKLPYYDCYVLGKWYVELILLRLLGYQGEYANRTRQDRWVGQVEKVPWA